MTAQSWGVPKPASVERAVAGIRKKIAKGTAYSSSRERITEDAARLFGEALMKAGYLDSDWCDEDGPFQEYIVACLNEWDAMRREGHCENCRRGKLIVKTALFDALIDCYYLGDTGRIGQASECPHWMPK